MNSLLDALTPHYTLVAAVGTAILCTCGFWPRAHHENMAQIIGAMAIIFAATLTWRAGMPDGLLYRLGKIGGIIFTGWLVAILVKEPLQHRKNRPKD